MRRRRSTGTAGDPVYVKNLEIRNQSVAIYVNPITHLFEATVDDVEFEATSIEALIDKISKTTKPVRVEIPVTRIEYGGTLTHGAVIGLHGGTGNILFKPEGKGTVEQLRSYGNDNVMLRLSLDEANALKSKKAAVAAAQRDLEAWLKPRVLTGFALKKLVEAEIAKKKATSEKAGE